MQSLIEVGHQSARLSQVLNGSANEAARLTDEVMSLAAANGRSNQEAMESAIAWSRLGLRRVQVAEAVRVSLLAANVAEITAAEATEHLSSLMVVYNLRASELGAVLGMLNNVTNTYNVTNKDLLTGLTRTAAIAKQAGIPLAELIGLLGAGVGATGQTGANIGNAIKSVIGSLSDEGKLKALRETFHFEGTRGMTGELKNMSQLLSEFWVAYVRMGQAERQSALFTVAGKNQASRMAALLDNYVRAQTLAISAQLNLNSAEQENARIKATLRNQLVGLVSEWQRFINLQGNRGPVQMLSQMTVALKNLIRVANAPGWNVAATGLLGLTGAVGAKMALTGYTLAQHQAAAGTSPVGRDKRSILVNTAAALGREMGVVKNVLAEMAVNGGWIWGNRKPAALLGMSEYARDAAGNLHKFSAAAGGAGVNMVRLGAGAKAARIAMAGFSDVLLPLLAITAALYGINWIMEKIGVSTDKAEDRISRLGESAQRASAAAESGEMRGRLFRTVERAFVAPETTQRTRVSLVNQLTEAYAPYEAGDDEAAMRRKDQIRERRRREGEAIARTANESERNARARQFFGQLEAESLDARNRQRRLARDRLSDQIAEIDATLRKPALSKAKRQELTEKRQGLTDQRITSLLQEGEENADAVERFKENSLEYKTAMEDQKKLLEEIRDLWNQLPGDTYLDKLNKQKLAAQQILEVGKAQLENLNQQVRQLGGIEMGYEEARARVAEENGAIRDERAKSKQKVLEAENAYRAEDAKYTNPFGGKLWQPQSVQGAYDKIQQAKVGNLRKQAELDQRQRANDRLEEQLSRVDTNTDAKRKMLERDEMRKRVQEAQVQIETLNNPARNAAAETMDRRAFALRYAGNEAVAWEIGETRAEQLAHRVGQLKLSYEAKEQLANSGVVQGIDAENLRLQALQQRVLYTEDLIRGEEMLVELGKEELNTMKQKTREYERSLLLAGPGELLRKLAVQSLSRDGMNAGQFLALDPSARQDWFSMPENSEEIRRIRRDRQALRNAGYGSRTMRQQQDLYVQGARERAGLMAQLRPEVPADIWEGARSAGASLANLANVATVLGGRFNELIRIITSYPGIRQVTVGPPPLAQNPNTR
jgi:TP901 family phage tail tape measure protein